MGSSVKLWSEGPQICNIDPKVMPHFSFQAKCNYCGEMVPFTTEVEREMRKHYNTKHRLYCNACKKGDFNSREELDTHLSAVHKDGICFKCHTSFKLASALAMHVEGPRNECAVPHEALVAALISVQHGVVDPSREYSPISCCSGNDNTVQKLKEFRKTLLLAHKRAYNFAAPATGNEIAQEVLVEQGANHSEGLESPTSSFATTSSDRSYEMITPSSNQDEWSLLLPMQWTCSTCEDAKFDSLTKLLQHVEQKVRNSWWMSIHH